MANASGEEYVNDDQAKHCGTGSNRKETSGNNDIGK
jgi:hypothetical protein